MSFVRQLRAMMRSPGWLLPLSIWGGDVCAHVSMCLPWLWPRQHAASDSRRRTAGPAMSAGKRCDSQRLPLGWARPNRSGEPAVERLFDQQFYVEEWAALTAWISANAVAL